MRRVVRIAVAEWRYWLRSRLAVAGIVIMAGLVVATAVLTMLRMDAERRAREADQAEAEATFLAQPDRHPHRMVHYGHYVFRTPAPLSVFDPGLEPVTGQSVFLEGHRQNAAMFTAAASSAELGGLGALTPAAVYQLLAPLLILLLGHAAFTREREAATLVPLMAQGVRGSELVAGKGLALAGMVIALLVPMLAAGIYARIAGESWAPILSLAGLHAAYLAFWGGLVLFASAMLRQRGAVLAGASAAWVVLALIVPGMAVNVATRYVPSPGKVETDLAMLDASRRLGDGHNAADPAFAALRAELLQQYGVDKVEDLPVNLRGIVAEQAEEKLTAVLNEFADRRMADEVAQAEAVRRFGWASPVVALGAGSRALSGTDLDAYHRFLREAEAVRYEFVQSLNRVHAGKLAYRDDVSRSSDPESERRTRVSSENWSLLERYRFVPAAVPERLGNAAGPAAMLLAWLLLAVIACVLASRRVRA